MATRRSTSRVVVEVIHFLLATVCLTSVFVPRGYGCTDRCSAETTDRISDGVNLMISNCTTSLIEVSYTRTDEYPGNSLTIRYTCELRNGTKIVEDGVLLCNSNRLMGTYPITNPEIEDGSVCQFYGCYVERDFIRRTHMKVNTVTCTVVDVDTCNQDCRNKGAIECQTDASGIAPSSYECVCQHGYVWNGTYCADVDECNTTDPLYQHNCMDDDSQCVNLEGTFTCEHCTSKEMWNGTNCVLMPPTGNMTMTTVDVTIATTPDIDTTGNGVAPTVASNLPVIASVSLVIISMVLVGLICAFVLILSCLHHRKRLEKSVHAEVNHSGYLGYVSDELDMNFEPLESIDVTFSTHSESVSVVSQLNRLWDLDDAGTTAPTTLPPNTIIIDTLHHSQLASSETNSCLNPSSELHYHVDSERDNGDKQTNAFTRTDGVLRQNGAPSSRLSAEEVLGSKLDVNFRLDGPLPTGDAHTSAAYPQRSFAPHQTAVHKFRQSSTSTLESDQAYNMVITGSGVTDSGYIMCGAPAEKEQT